MFAFFSFVGYSQAFSNVCTGQCGNNARIPVSEFSQTSKSGNDMCIVVYPKHSQRKNAWDDEKKRLQNTMYSASEKDKDFKSNNNHKSMQTKSEWSHKVRSGTEYIAWQSCNFSFFLSTYNNIFLLSYIILCTHLNDVVKLKPAQALKERKQAYGLRIL